MKLLDRSVAISRSLLPPCLIEKRKTYHFAFVYRRNKLLAIGQNAPKKESKVALDFAKRFGTQTNYPFKHAEIDVIAKLWGRVYVGSDLKMVVVRLNPQGETRDSKPCRHCQTVLDALNIHRIYWTCRSDTVGEN